MTMPHVYEVQIETLPTVLSAVVPELKIRFVDKGGPYIDVFLDGQAEPIDTINVWDYAKDGRTHKFDETSLFEIVSEYLSEDDDE